MRRFGPGFLVAAAFIGPGTVTTASLAGAAHGLTLVWAVLAAIAATLVLQGMAARLGAVAGIGLGEAVRGGFRQPVARAVAVGLALLAITFGNAAYQGGNLTGAALGLESLLGGARPAWVLLTALAAAALLATGAYRFVERALVALVALMGVTFVGSAALVLPVLPEVLPTLTPLRVPAGAGLLTLALIGTTVVPYNLFLHAAAVREKWRGVEPARALHESRRDSLLAVSLGGLVTLAILFSAAPLFLAAVQPAGVAELARQLEPLLGAGARWLFAAGLFAAGLTSAITAPLAAAWATSGLLGWQAELRDWRFRAVWGAVIVVGAGFAATGTRPLHAIVLAQAANGLLLPVIAAFLLWAVNRRDIMGGQGNGAVANWLGAAVVGLSMILGITTIYRIQLW